MKHRFEADASQPGAEPSGTPIDHLGAPSPAPLRPVVAGGAERHDSFSAAELAIALSHFDLGVIRAIVPFEKGSPESPKVFIRAARGEFLLKRRPERRADPDRLRFIHRLQSHLREAGFPTPRLIPPSLPETPDVDADAYVVRLDGHAYELGEFVRGQPYDKSTQATREAGRALAAFHSVLATHPESAPDGAPERVAPGAYHRSDHLINAGDRLAHAVRSAEGARISPDDVHARIGELLDRYSDAADRVEALGYRRWPYMFVHGDWHPGNMVFRMRQVAAILDFDSARIEPRIADVSNAALQFSLTTGGDDVEVWPAELDFTRLAAFLEGYDSYHTSFILSAVEMRALPWLMIESLIAEAVAPIAATGRFAGLRPMPFLAMIAEKAEWIANHADELVERLGG